MRYVISEEQVFFLLLIVLNKSNKKLLYKKECFTNFLVYNDRLFVAHF